MGSYITPDTISFGFSGLTKKPFSPSKIASEIPPVKPPITGFPQAKYDCTLPGIVAAKIGSDLKVTNIASAREK